MEDIKRKEIEKIETIIKESRNTEYKFKERMSEKHVERKQIQDINGILYLIKQFDSENNVSTSEFYKNETEFTEEEKESGESLIEKSPFKELKSHEKINLLTSYIRGIVYYVHFTI